jgi:hypothetical protein
MDESQASVGAESALPSLPLLWTSNSALERSRRVPHDRAW